MQALIDELIRRGLRVERDEPMAKHTSFRIGGPVAAMVFPGSDEEIALAAELILGGGLTPLVIGNGSNLLVTDGPVDRIAVKTHDGLGRLKRLDDKTVYAGSGALLSRVAAFARDLELTGLEFAHGIPGTLGGAVCMNAGAYGGEMAGVVACVHYLDSALNRRTGEGAELEFRYRHSLFSRIDGIVLGAELSLSPGDRSEIKAEMEELARRRRDSQPLNYPSGGSTFKRPEGGYAAALIDGAGLKGFSIGGAQVSEKHAGFVINRGGATFDDVLRVMEHIQETVLRTAGVRLEPELKIIR